ncbi:MAG: hypothetical protein ACI8R4_002675 [Paracoccaceae bacterium]|jgi:hypothetical protein
MSATRQGQPRIGLLVAFPQMQDHALGAVCEIAVGG